MHSFNRNLYLGQYPAQDDNDAGKAIAVGNG
jgi:hypothetical protein